MKEEPRKNVQIRAIPAVTSRALSTLRITFHTLTLSPAPYSTFRFATLG
jgi:hypothetical protein